MPTFGGSSLCADPTKDEGMRPFCVCSSQLTFSPSLNPLDPQDWAANRMEEQTRDFKVDYVTLKPTKVALTVAWSFVMLDATLSTPCYFRATPLLSNDRVLLSLLWELEITLVDSDTITAVARIGKG
jgi:hypothetical protein